MPEFVMGEMDSDLLDKKGFFCFVKENSIAGSWMWRKILRTREVAKKFHRVKANNGKFTSFWYGNWSSLGPLKDLLGARGTLSMGIPENSTVADVFQNHRRKNHRIVILNRVEEKIEKIKSENLQVNDIALRKSKESYNPFFSSRNTWLLIRKEHSVQEWSKGIWFKHATPKYPFHVWTAMQNRSSTCDRMMKWNSAIDPMRVLCKQDFETRDHMFYICLFSCQIWRKLVKEILLARYTEKWEEIVAILLDKRLERVKLFLLRYTFQATTHSIWRERNRRRHGEKELPYILLTKIIDKNVRNRLSTIKRIGDHKLESGLRVWFDTR